MEQEAAAADMTEALKSANGKPERLWRLLAIVREEIPRQVQGLRDALAGDDAPTAERHAHTLKSQAAHMGGQNLREIALQAEQQGKAGATDKVRALLPQIEAEADGFMACINAWTLEDIKKAAQ